MTEGSPIFSVEGIAALAAQRSGQTLWIDDLGERSWAEFGAAVADVRSRGGEAGVKPGEIVVTPGAGSFEALAWLFGAAALGAVVAPLRPERRDEATGWGDFVTVAWQVHDGLVRGGGGTPSAHAERLFGELRARAHPGLILATGGTTGTPKLVLHDLAALLAVVPVKTGRPSRTLPLMRFDHIGGLDMAWRALAGGQILVAPPAEISPETVARSIALHRVEVLPATPSFLNLMLVADVARNHDLGSLRLVPYGAEPMPAGLLARLRAAWPQVNFVQRFGTSETGALPVRSTPAGLELVAGGAGYNWKVIDGELWVQSPARALGYLSGPADGLEIAGWFKTGDLAEQGGDGVVRVLGRRTDVINVGGEKVRPDAVEAELSAHPAVADCRVFAVPNALLGQVVGAEVVWRGPEQDALAVKRILHEWTAALPNCHRPAVVRLVATIYTGGNFKKQRSDG